MELTKVKADEKDVVTIDDAVFFFRKPNAPEIMEIATKIQDDPLRPYKAMLNLLETVEGVQIEGEDVDAAKFKEQFFLLPAMFHIQLRNLHLDAINTSKEDQEQGNAA